MQFCSSVIFTSVYVFPLPSELHLRQCRSPDSALALYGHHSSNPASPSLFTTDIHTPLLQSAGGSNASTPLRPDYPATRVNTGTTQQTSRPISRPTSPCVSLLGSQGYGDVNNIYDDNVSDRLADNISFLRQSIFATLLALMSSRTPLMLIENWLTVSNTDINAIILTQSAVSRSPGSQLPVVAGFSDHASAYQLFGGPNCMTLPALMTAATVESLTRAVGDLELSLAQPLPTPPIVVFQLHDSLIYLKMP